MSPAEFARRIEEVKTLAAQGFAYDTLEAKCALYEALIRQTARTFGVVQGPLNTALQQQSLAVERLEGPDG